MPWTQTDSDEGSEGANQDGDERSSAAALGDARRAGPSREGRGGPRPDAAPDEGEKRNQTSKCTIALTMVTLPCSCVCVTGHGAAAQRLPGDAAGEGGAGRAAAPQGEGAERAEGGAEGRGRDSRQLHGSTEGRV